MKRARMLLAVAMPVLVIGAVAELADRSGGAKRGTHQARPKDSVIDQFDGQHAARWIVTPSAKPRAPH